VSQLDPIVTEHFAAMKDITKYVPALKTEKYDWAKGPFTPVTSDIIFTLAKN
jgi:hypothetical protein